MNKNNVLAVAPTPWRNSDEHGWNAEFDGSSVVTGCASIADATGETVALSVFNSDHISGLDSTRDSDIRDQIVRAVNAHADLVAALTAAIRVADEARDEWDAAPGGMKAGKLLIALSGHLPGYRADIDAIHVALAEVS